MVIKQYPEYPDAKHPNEYERGIEFQDFVVEKMASELGIVFTYYQSRKFQFGRGENKQGIETKLDEPSSQTSRLSIEIAEKSRAINPFWIPSGIYRHDNTWLYIQGNYDIFFIFTKNLLKALHKQSKYKEHEEPRDNPTVRAFYMPIKDAKKYAAKYLEFS